MTEKISDAELAEIYSFALDLGRRAGKILLDGIKKRTGDASSRGDGGKMEEKMNAVDIVTQTDLGTPPPSIPSHPMGILYETEG